MAIHANRKHLIILILTIVSLPVLAIYGLGAAVTGLAGINPENIGKVAVYPVSDSAVTVIKYVAVFVAVPIGLIAVVLAGINMRLKKNSLNTILIGYLYVAIVWLFFLSWALTETYVDSSEVDNSSSHSNQSGSDEGSSFKAKIIQLN